MVLACALKRTRGNSRPLPHPTPLPTPRLKPFLSLCFFMLIVGRRVQLCEAKGRPVLPCRVGLVAGLPVRVIPGLRQWGPQDEVKIALVTSFSTFCLPTKRPLLLAEGPGTAATISNLSRECLPPPIDRGKPVMASALPCPLSSYLGRRTFVAFFSPLPSSHSLNQPSLARAVFASTKSLSSRGDFLFTRGRPRRYFLLWFQDAFFFSFDTFHIEPDSTKSGIQGMATPELSSLVPRVSSMGKID